MTQIDREFKLLPDAVIILREISSFLKVHGANEIDIETIAKNNVVFIRQKL